jgi:hypothetical protein
LQGELLDHFDGGLGDGGGPAGVVGGGDVLAFDDDFELIGLGAVGAVAVGVADDAGGEEGEGGPGADVAGGAAAAAEVDGEVVDAVAGDVDGLFGVFGFEEGSGGGDGDGFGGGADGEGDVEA